MSLRKKLTSPLLARTLLVLSVGSVWSVHAQPTDGCDQDYCAQDAIFQTGPLQALMVGVLESPVAFSTGLAHGDFGLGGLSPLDGEVIVLDGQAYQARLDGQLRRVDPNERTSILMVKRFVADRTLNLSAVSSLDDLTAQLDRHLQAFNRIHAIRIDGRFDYLRLRSVPRQSPPYVPVTEVVKSQLVLELENVEGTVVAFRFPPWAVGINSPGYHMHFVNAARTQGGHVLDVRAGGLSAQVDTTRAVIVMTPDDSMFDNADFNEDKGAMDYQEALRPGNDTRK
jgi:acetolactate decarboxylase